MQAHRASRPQPAPCGAVLGQSGRRCWRGLARASVQPARPLRRGPTAASPAEGGATASGCPAPLPAPALQQGRPRRCLGSIGPAGFRPDRRHGARWRAPPALRVPTTRRAQCSEQCAPGPAHCPVQPLHAALREEPQVHYRFGRQGQIPPRLRRASRDRLSQRQSVRGAPHGPAAAAPDYPARPKRPAPTAPHRSTARPDRPRSGWSGLADNPP